MDLTTELNRIYGVDLTSIAGIDVITAQTILSEIGTDMSGFKTEDHFASWLGLTPAKDITGGKIIGPGRRKVQNRVAMAATPPLGLNFDEEPKFFDLEAA